jgi:tryptophan synthase alpha subunit
MAAVVLYLGSVHFAEKRRPHPDLASKNAEKESAQTIRLVRQRKLSTVPRIVYGYDVSTKKKSSPAEPEEAISMASMIMIDSAIISIYNESLNARLIERGCQLVKGLQISEFVHRRRGTQLV